MRYVLYNTPEIKKLPESFQLISFIKPKFHPNGLDFFKNNLKVYKPKVLKSINYKLQAKWIVFFDSQTYS